MTYIEFYRGRAIYVVVDRPLIRYYTEKDFRPADGFFAWFKLDDPPGVTEGELLKNEDGEARAFDAPEQAADAAVEAGRQRVDAGG